MDSATSFNLMNSTNIIWYNHFQNYPGYPSEVIMKAFSARRQMMANPQRSAMIVLLILVSTLLVTSVVGAQSSLGWDGIGQALPEAPNVATVVPGGPGIVMLTSMNFRPYTATNTSYSFTGYGLKNNDVVEQSFIAPLQLPNGVTIKKIVLYYSDLDNLKQINALLVAVPMTFGYGVVMASISSVNNTSMGYSETTTINTPVVDLVSNAYAIQVTMPASSSVMLIGARIDYAYQTVLPVINK
jgi:hypothetical protein